MKSRLLVIGDLSSIHLKMWTDSLFGEYEVYAITMASENLTKIPNENVYFCKSLPISKLTSIFSYFFVNKVVNEVTPDLIHAHYASSYGLMGAYAKAKHKVLSAWGSDVNDIDDSWYRKFIMSYVVKRYDVINCASKDIENKLNLLDASLVLDTFQYGVDIDVIPVKLKSEFNDPPVFISNRGFDPLYRIDDIVMGFDLYCQKGGTGKLQVFGFGCERDVERVKILITKLDNKNIVFYGKVDKATLMDYLSLADVYISIPNKDGAPLSLYEAMHVGLYPVVSSINSNIETFSSGHASFVDTCSPEEISETLLHIPTLITECNYQEVNRELVATKYSYKNNIDKIKGIYRSLITQG